MEQAVSSGPTRTFPPPDCDDKVLGDKRRLFRMWWKGVPKIALLITRSQEATQWFTEWQKGHPGLRERYGPGAGGMC